VVTVPIRHYLSVIIIINNNNNNDRNFITQHLTGTVAVARLAINKSIDRKQSSLELLTERLKGQVESRSLGGKAFQDAGPETRMIVAKG